MLRDHFVLHLGVRRPQELRSDGRAFRRLKPEDIVGRLGPLMSMQPRPLVQNSYL